MSYQLEPIHSLGDFIQEQASGALIRQWLMMCEADKSLSIKVFLEDCLQAQAETMEKTLLQLAASYPNRAVRAELIWLYGLFVKENNSLHRFTPGILTDDYELAESILYESSNS